MEIRFAVTNKTNPENIGGNDDYDHHHQQQQHHRRFKKGAFCQFMNCINGFSFWQ
jgi:hypothetical protein